MLSTNHKTGENMVRLIRLNDRTILLVCGTDLKHIHSYEPIMEFSNAVPYCNMKVVVKN